VKLAVYRNSLVFGLTQVTNYRSEVWLVLVNKIVYLLGVVFLWSIIGKNLSGGVGVANLVSYFLIANGVQGLVDAESLRFSRTLNNEIKQGGLNSHLLRPVNTVLYMYFSFLGTRGINMIMTTLLMFVGIVFLAGFSWVQLVFFIISLGLAFLNGFVMNLLVGSLTFWTPEANHLQNVASHVIRVFSGTLIPISFFTGGMRSFLIWSPFPSVAYLPSVIMQTTTANSDLVTIFLSAMIWPMILIPISLRFWKAGLKRYEAIGI